MPHEYHGVAIHQISDPFLGLKLHQLKWSERPGKTNDLLLGINGSDYLSELHADYGSGNRQTNDHNCIFGALDAAIFQTLDCAEKIFRAPSVKTEHARSIQIDARD